MKEEREFLVNTLKRAGASGKIHESIKSMKNCSNVHVCGVMRVGESFVRSGSKKRYEDKEGHRKQRNRLFKRVTVLHVVIADANEDKVEHLLTEFLKHVSKGFPVGGNWVDIEIGDADWTEEGDSILKSRIAVEFDVTLTGGIYEDVDIRTAMVGNISLEKEQEEQLHGAE